MTSLRNIYAVYARSISKVLRNVLLELEKIKPENEELTVKTFRKLPKRHIEAQEACDIEMKLFRKLDESPKPPYT